MTACKCLMQSGEYPLLLHQFEIFALDIKFLMLSLGVEVKDLWDGKSWL